MLRHLMRSRLSCSGNNGMLWHCVSAIFVVIDVPRVQNVIR